MVVLLWNHLLIWLPEMRVWALVAVDGTGLESPDYLVAGDKS